MALPSADLLQRLAAITGPEGIRTDPADLASFGRDWSRKHEPDPLAVVLPASISQVQAIVKLANELGLALVPSGGRTGMSAGAVAASGEVVVAFDRMNNILGFDPVDRQLVCQPGVLTAQAQQFAEEQGLFYPVDFASSGSSQLGGNVATNAGGIKVIRYGMTRNWIAGLKVVTGRGELLDLNRGLTKNATGYDFRHLFIGSEGTLGFVVELTLNLCSAPQDPGVIVVGLDHMGSCMEVLKAFRKKMELTAFEFFSERALSLVTREKNLQRPFANSAPYYALIEFEKRSEQDSETLLELFEQCLAEGWITDGTISQSQVQAKNLWRLREDISETIAPFFPYKNDISVRPSNIPAFLAEAEALVVSAYPDFETIWFGHIGDGNIHLNILKPQNLPLAEFQQRCDEVSQQVFELVEKFEGSISAEHGIGLLKKPFLHYSRSAPDIEYMKAVKNVFDPNNVMNPGKLIDA